jgi:hypothetical protein
MFRYTTAHDNVAAKLNERNRHQCNLTGGRAGFVAERPTAQKDTSVPS